MIRDGTEKDSKEVAERHLENWFFPRLQETMAEIISQAQASEMPTIELLEEADNRFADDFARGCYVEDQGSYAKVEGERWKNFLKDMKITNINKDFQFKKYDKQLNGIPLKLVVQNYCTYGPDSEMENLYEKLNNHN